MPVGDSRPWFGKSRRVAGSLSEYALLFALVIFHLVNNWIYLSTRATILGLDWPSHVYIRALPSRHRIFVPSVATLCTPQG